MSRMIAKGSTRLQAEVRAKERASSRSISLQCMRKDGSWGVARLYDTYGTCNTAELLIAKLEELNPGKQFRVAQ